MFNKPHLDAIRLRAAFLLKTVPDRHYDCHPKCSSQRQVIAKAMLVFQTLAVEISSNGFLSKHSSRGRYPPSLQDWLYYVRGFVGPSWRRSFGIPDDG
jgi:hypothetical protein